MGEEHLRLLPQLSPKQQLLGGTVILRAGLRRPTCSPPGALHQTPAQLFCSSTTTTACPISPRRRRPRRHASSRLCSRARSPRRCAPTSPPKVAATRSCASRSSAKHQGMILSATDAQWRRGSPRHPGIPVWYVLQAVNAVPKDDTFETGWGPHVSDTL
jgi:hypothetical protein